MSVLPLIGLQWLFVAKNEVFVAVAGIMAVLGSGYLKSQCLKIMCYVWHLYPFRKHALYSFQLQYYDQGVGFLMDKPFLILAFMIEHIS